MMRDESAAVADPLEQRTGPYAVLAFTVGLVVDAAESDGCYLDDEAGVALGALAGALRYAAGVPDDRRWRDAYGALSTFAARADGVRLGPGGRPALYTIRAFLHENADLAERQP